MSGGLSLVRGAAIASVLACVPPEVPPPVAPGLLWVRDLETSDAGPLLWWGAEGVPTGAVYGFRDSLVALDAATGAVLQAWAWPPGFRDRSWEQERFSSSPYGVALFGAQSAAILRPDGSVENRPYPIGGASFCSGSLSATGELLLSWRRDSSATGPEANQSFGAMRTGGPRSPPHPTLKACLTRPSLGSADGSPYFAGAPTANFGGPTADGFARCP